jgi:hypothetical protein
VIRTAITAFAEFQVAVSAFVRVCRPDFDERSCRRSHGPLVAHDAIFANVKDLELLTRLGQ